MSVRLLAFCGSARKESFNRRLLAASPGAMGGIRCLPHLRLLQSNLGVTVSPAQLALGHAGQAFARDGDLADAKQQAALEKLVADPISLTAGIRA